MMWDFILRLFVAGILGAVVGLDREYRAKEAGYRTHFLVSLGSALIMVVSQYGFQDVILENSVSLDPSRVAAQVVSGIGFIGAGTIIIQKQFVRGLTTAAGIWATAGIGLAVGSGMYGLGIAATLLTLFQTREEIAGEIRDALLPALKGERIDAIYFYGAGCAFPEKNRIVEEAITPYIPAPIEVYSDLMAAARALCGSRPGIACILGTGSNSCLYDGTEITEHISPLGFILGDEGSGAVLGKLLVGDCLKRQLPAPLVRKFMDQYELTPALLLERVYKQPFPNRFLATLSRFLLENITEQPIYNLVYTSFRSFFLRNVALYPGADTYPIHFVGSIAYYYQEVLKAAALSLDLKVGTVVQAPMNGLIRYHFTNEEKNE